MISLADEEPEAESVEDAALESPWELDSSLANEWLYRLLSVMQVTNLVDRAGTGDRFGLN